MAGNPFQRVLGETRLERRCRLLLALCLFAVISIGFFWYGGQTERLLHQQDTSKASLLVDNIMIQVHWPVWADVKDLDSFIAAQAVGLQREKYAWRFLKAQGSGFETQNLDVYERQELERFLAVPPGDETADQRANFGERLLQDRLAYEYYQPIYARSELCINCHRKAAGQPDLKMNELMAVAKVQFSIAGREHEVAKDRAMLITASLITSAVAAAASFAILRYLVFSPLERLQGPGDEVWKER